MKESLTKKRYGVPAALTIAIIGALISGGAAFAYFTDMGSTTQNKLGLSDEPAVDLKLSNNNQDWSNNVVKTWNVDGLYPGGSYADTIYIKNTGDRAVNTLTPNLSINSKSPSDFAKHIYITELRDTSRTDQNNVADVDMYHNMVDTFAGAYGDNEMPLTLQEFANDTPCTVFAWIKGEGKAGVPVLKANSNNDYALYIEFEIDNSLGNNWEGAKAMFSMDFTANPVPTEEAE